MSITICNCFHSRCKRDAPKPATALESGARCEAPKYGRAEWIQFFLNGVATIAAEATDAARGLFGLVNADRARVLGAPTSSLTAVRLFELLPQHPIVSIARVVELLGTTKPTATKAVHALIQAGVLTEATGRRRDRTFHYTEYLTLLRVGTELQD